MILLTHITPRRVGQPERGNWAQTSALTHLGFNLLPDAIWAFAGNELQVSGPNGTAGIFATYPSGHLDMINGFFDQVWAGDM